MFGSGGQLGRELARASWPDGVQPVCPPEADADITEPGAVERWIATPDVGCVINAAAYTAVDRAESERELAFRVNCDGPRVLARACANAHVPLIHVSTDYVFDGTKSGAYTEDDPVCPLGVYGESKAAGEAAVREALRQHVIVRTAWVFSAFGHNFVKTIVRLAAERDRLRVVADQFGRPTPAADLARGLIAVVAKHARGGDVGWGTYHFAGAGRASWHDLATSTVELQAIYTQRRPPVDPIATSDYPTPARRPLNSELETTRFVEEFACEPRPWRQGLQAVVNELFRV